MALSKKGQVLLYGSIVLNGTTTPGFNSLGDKLLQLGTVVSQISGTVGDWLKDSTEIYKDYETIMLEVNKQMEGAYREQGKTTAAFKKDFAGLETQIQNWASTTIYHVSDVSESVLLAARSGWTYEQMLSGIPAAMNLAQAGGIELSTAVDYLTKSLNATQTPFSEAERFMDMWAYAANNSATNIDEVGLAMTRMASTMQFADSNSELLALIATLANVGETGQKAGTLLRNSILRIAAPTESAHKKLRALSTDYNLIAQTLGVDVETGKSIWQLYQNGGVGVESIQKMGFTQAQAERIYSDLVEYSETFQNAQKVYIDNIPRLTKLTEEAGFSAYDAEGNLKPVIEIYRDLATALYSVNEAGERLFTEEDINILLKDVFGMRSITAGKTFLEFIDELENYEKRISGATSEGYAGSMAKSRTSGLYGAQELLLSAWEEFSRQMGEIVSEPLTVGYNFLTEFINTLNNADPIVLSGIASAATAISVAGPALLTAGLMAKMFTSLGAVGSSVLLAGLGISFAVGAFSKMSEVNFKEQFGSLSVDLETVMADINAVKTKFDEEYESIKKLDEAAKEAQRNYETALYGLNEALLTEVLTSPDFTIEDYARFETLGKNLVEAAQQGVLKAQALDKGFLEVLFGNSTTFEGEGEQFEFASGLVEGYYGGLYAEAYEVGEQIRRQFTLALQDGTMDENDRQAVLAQVQRLNQIEAAIAQEQNKAAYESMLYKAGQVSWDTAAEFVKENAARETEAVARVNAQYESLAGTLGAAWEAAAETGGSLTWTDANGVQHEISTAGKSKEDLFAWIRGEQSAAVAAEQAKYNGPIAAMVSALLNAGNDSNLWAGYYALWQAGATWDWDENSNKRLDLSKVPGDVLERVATEYWANENGNFRTEFFSPGAMQRLTNLAGYEDQMAMLNALYPGMGTLLAWNSTKDQNAWLGQGTIVNAVRNAYQQTPEYLIATYTAELEALEAKLPGLQAAAEANNLLNNPWGGLSGATKRTQGELDYATNRIAELKALIEKLTKQKAKVSLDTTEADAWLTTVHPINAVVELVGAGDEPVDGYANGGRATVASIFGEAGPEWAIPEEHSARTASLLDAARRASGFTWAELLGLNGGMNAGETIVVNIGDYAPVISTDGGGLAGELLTDKQRLADVVRDAVRRALSEIRTRRAAAMAS